MPAHRSRQAPPLCDGEVTALVSRRGRDERVAVHLDGRRAFDLSAVVADRAGLRAGVRLTVDQQRDLIDQDAPYRAREQALRLLGLRERSRRELEIRLLQAGYCASVIDDTLEWLAGLGYLDDRRFAQIYATEKLRGGWGPRRVSSELAAKGIERAIIEETLARIRDESGVGLGEGEVSLERTIRRRFAGQFAADPVAAERRLAGFLARRGHDHETIEHMVRMLRAETSEEPGFPSIP